MTWKLKYLVLLLFISLGGIAPSNAANAPVDPKVIHIINRLSFGPRPGDIQKVESMGVERYIQQQLSPNSIPESPSLNAQLSQLKSLQLSSAQLLNEYSRTSPGQKLTPEQREAAQKRAREVLAESVQARLLQATTSNRQLQEVMVDFWYNHFNVYANKGRDRLLVGAYEQQAIRPYALGRFRDLLAATARHPAMLFYLDNWQNTAPGSPGARGRFQGLNENYARELMELHTLGVDGGYTQQDVIALARILTGWGFSRPKQQINDSSGFYFDPKRHDFSDKVFLKQTIKGSGMAEGEQALDILARSPATAHHISYKLAQYFVQDNPPSALVDHLTERFLSTDGDIRAVLDTLFHSKEFWDSKNFNTKFKTPYEYAISAVRATGSEVKNTKPIVKILQQLGMPLYGYQTPEGYKNTQQAWLNPEAMNRRLGFATAIASGRLQLSTIPMEQDNNDQINPIQPVDALQLADTLGNSFSPRTQSAIASSPPQLRAALILGSPEFMQR
ncbi:MAG: DUF1800 domain-containing protein [Nostoc sp.]